jgi:hypothetical protein
MFIIDQFQTTLEDGTLHMSDEESVSNISPSNFTSRRKSLNKQIGGGGIFGPALF